MWGWGPTASGKATAQTTAANGSPAGRWPAQARWLAEQGIAGTALYRYDSLFENAAWPELAAQECAALRAASGA